MQSIMFVLPVGGGSGGAHSVMQEADAMWSLGVPVSIAANTVNAAKLRRGYSDLRTIQQHVHGYDGPEQLGALIEAHKPDAVVATTNQSVHVLARALKVGTLQETTRTAYYIQDYEPLFYERGSDDWLTAHQSYGLIPGMVHFAKTQWLQEIVSANHGVQVFKVEPSIDHTVYFPRIAERFRPREPVVIAAMLRPSTPRRAPRRTVRILNRIAHEFGGQVTCVSFGCTPEELHSESLRLSGVEHLGVLRRSEVGDLFRGADLFLDLSDFQAFGRTAIEAMSCGTVCVVPAHGGAYEFADDGVNGFVVDTRDDGLIMAAVRQYLAATDAERDDMALRAITAGYRYSPERAALSELLVLGG